MTIASLIEALSAYGTIDVVIENGGKGVRLEHHGERLACDTGDELEEALLGVVRDLAFKARRSAEQVAANDVRGNRHGADASQPRPVTTPGDSRHLEGAT